MILVVLIFILLQQLIPQRALHIPRLRLSLHAVYPIDEVDLEVEDPFLSQKQQLLRSSFQYAEDLSMALPKILVDEEEDALRTSLYLALWASCPSYYGSPTPRKTASTVYQQLPSLLDNIRENHIERLIVYLLDIISKRTSEGITNTEIAIVTSNVGSGLFADLLIGHVLLSLNVCDRIRYITRSIPDEAGVLVKDVLGAIGILSDPTSSDVWTVRHFGDALGVHITEGRFFIDEGVYRGENLDSSEATVEVDIEKVDVSCQLLLLMGQHAWYSAVGTSDDKMSDIELLSNFHRKWDKGTKYGDKIQPPAICAMKVDDEFDIEEECADIIFIH